MNLRFNLDDARDPRVVAFLQAHLDDMRRVSPPESVHALDLDQLRVPDIRFWTAWQDTKSGVQLVGSCALKLLSAQHAELKSMRVAEGMRGSGAAQQVLDYALRQAEILGMERVSLETGSEEFFAPARRLYARNGFAYCAPFGRYIEDPHSCFMTRSVTATLESVIL